MIGEHTLNELRIEYQQLTQNLPDRRWKEHRLEEEIELIEERLQFVSEKLNK